MRETSLSHSPEQHPGKKRPSSGPRSATHSPHWASVLPCHRTGQQGRSTGKTGTKGLESLWKQFNMEMSRSSDINRGPSDPPFLSPKKQCHSPSLLPMDILGPCLVPPKKKPSSTNSLTAPPPDLQNYQHLCPSPPSPAILRACSSLDKGHELHRGFGLHATPTPTSNNVTVIILLSQHC